MRRLMAGILTLCVVAGCRGGANPAAGPAVPASQPGGEVAAAKETIRKLSEQKTVAGIAPYLSNRSAAAMGLVLMIPVGLVTGLAGLGDAFGNLSPSGAAGAASADKAHQEMQAVKRDFDALIKKYGLDTGKKPGEEEVKRLESRGRQFMADMGSLIDRLDRSQASTGQNQIKPKGLAKNVDDLDYQVVSPTEVKLIPKSKTDTPGRAIVEDGAWRIDFGGLNDFAKQMGASKG